ncbi:MAG: SCO family protein [Arcobacter sp.]|nr:SCO family protein [Arcobacter sp.]
MKKMLSFFTVIIISVIGIYLIQPMVDKYKENKKYDFNVSSINGELTKDSFKGKVFAIYFGYTYCPDVCPTSLSSLAQALKTFSNKKQDDFKGLFISVDPNRDKIEALEEYSKYFHKNFSGATSNKDNIDDIVKRFGAYYANIYLENSKMDYTVSHTSNIYLFDRDGNFVEKINHFSDVDYIKKSLEKIL